MEVALTVPDSELVRQACAKFDRENEVTEKALADLLAAYPANQNPSHVLLKVVALNSLYTTRILAVLKLAHHIAERGAGLDAALATGSPETVDLIALAGNGDKDRLYYSFATKYCSWHRPDLYPIYDSRVEKYLWALRKQDLVPSAVLSYQDDLSNFPKFREVMTAFREEFGLGSFTFKQIDKFLWSQGEAIWAVENEEAREEAAALGALAGQDEAGTELANPAAEPMPETTEAPVESETYEGVDMVPAGEEELEVYHPTPETLRGGGKLFLDMFQNAPAESSGEVPNDGKP